LRALYENAVAFVHPSRYEGFGLPPLEAMALGCPVICSNAAALPETCGDAALYFEPDDFRQLARLIDEVLSDADLRSRLSHNGRQRLDHFGWDHTANAYWELLRDKGLVQREAVAS